VTEKQADTAVAIDWLEQAACAGADPETFCADELKGAALEAARAVCRSCPVTRQCAGYAVEIGAVHGLWAGQWRTWQSPAQDRFAAA